MKYNLNINDRAFNAIIDGTKRIEIRANTDNNYGELNIDDIICFINSKYEMDFFRKRNKIFKKNN